MTRAAAAAALVVLSLAASVPARAEFDFDGRALLEKCDSEDARVQAWCLGYVTGVVDYSSVRVGVRRQTVCLPRTVSDFELRAAVLSFLKSSPKRLGEPARMLAWDAVALAFPCRD